MRAVPFLLLGAAALAGCSSTAAPHQARPRPATRHARPTADPYRASLAYARCLRAHGVPHPDPNRQGDFSLTAADERRLKSVPRRQREAATRACFHYLKGLDNRPLSRQGQNRALAVLRELGRCLERHGRQVGNPIVRNMTMGRMMFGFDTVVPGATQPGYLRDQHACERQVHLAKRLDAIIADDRSGF